MWESAVEGKKLTFHLAGINNQNFIMRDDETGTWWQQVSGEAIQGPLKGRKLTPVYNDELTFALWKRENRQGRVLKPDDRVKQNYEAADWEKQYAKLRVVTPVDPNDKLSPRMLIAGLAINGRAKAYPLPALEKQRLILDNLGAGAGLTPLFIVLGDDNKSVRAFERRVDGRTLEFFVKADTTPIQLTDAETATTWDFTGKAVSGPLAGKQLKKIMALKDYWFDWKIYHPDTTVYKLGEETPQSKP
ncbi:MAG: DUF3179 domain-containing protein [Blastocatellia bacterium]|nr:DUF3179 domain-containing protein [Blastocatellia bacterium]